jgi:putative endonuclease
MTTHIDIGKAGEELAVAWLRQRDYTILYCNWRYGKLEIDIIATKGQFLHFVEVKTLRASRFGNLPEASVTKKKFKNLQRAADEYLFQHPGHRWIQYDVLAITLVGNGEAEYYLLADVFL